MFQLIFWTSKHGTDDECRTQYKDKQRFELFPFYIPWHYEVDKFVLCVVCVCLLTIACSVTYIKLKLTYSLKDTIKLSSRNRAMTFRFNSHIYKRLRQAVVSLPATPYFRHQ